MQKLLLIVTTCFIFLNSLSGQTGVYSISGKITGKDGSSLAGAGVYIESGSGGTTSGPDGSYSLSSLKEGTYTIRFSFLGYETQTRKTDVHGNTILNVSLEPSAVLTNEVLVNATRAGEHTPLAYAVIERDELRKTGFAQDMPYLLGLTPSLVETSEAGNGVGYTSLRIRGTDANRINVTVDGIPLNDPESQQVFWVDLPDLASSVDNIQIQRGVGTSSNGAGAFGATISVQTLNPDKEPGAEISSSYGSFNTMKNTVSAGTGLLAGKFAFQMRYSDIRSDGYIDRTGSHHQSAFLTGVYRSGKSRLKANIILGKEHTGIGWWGVPKDSLKTNRKYNPAGEYTNEYGELSYYPNESDNYDQNHYQLIYTYSPHENLNINAAIHYTKGKGYYEEYRDDQDLREYNMSPFSIGSQVITSTDMIRRKWMDNDFYGMVYSLNYHINRAELIVGGGINRYQGDHFGKIIWMRNAGNSEKDFEWYFNNSLKDEISIYGKLNYDLAEKIRLYGDLQLRSIHYNMSGFDDDLKDLGQGHRFNFFNPKAGLFYTISQNQDAWLSFSVAHREPTRSDYKEASGDAEATPKPETLYDTEAGYKFEGQNGSLSTSLYAMIYHDQLVPTGELSDVGYSIMTNVGKSYRLGVEISGSLRITDNISWNSSLTLSRNKISDFVEYYTDYNTNDWSSQYLSKNLGLVDIAYSPSQVWSNDLDFHKGIFSIHIISKFVGKQYFDNTRNPERTIDPYFVNNLRLDVTPKLNSLKQLDIQLLVNNILNERYENNAYGGNWYEDGQEKTWSYYFPQAGTNYMLRLSFKF